MKMKRLTVTMVLAMIVMLMAGCANNNSAPQAGEANIERESQMLSLAEIREQAKDLHVSVKNLDLSEAKITIPKVDEVYDLTFPVSSDSFERQVEKFEENIRKYEGLEEDVDLTKYMNIMYWDKQQDDRLTVPYNEATEQQKQEIQYLGYNDGKCSELIVFSNFMLEMGDYSVPTQLLGDDTDYAKNEYGYRGYELGELVKSYDLSTDDISGVSYHLSDGDLALSDAVSYVEKHLKEDYYFAGSEILDYHVFAVNVRKLTDNVYYYEFDVSTSYQNLVLNKDDSIVVVPEGEMQNEDSLEPAPFGTNHFVSMFQKERLGFIWSCCQNFETVEVNHTYQKILSLEEACRLLGDYISKNKTFQISTIDLIYHTVFEYESEEKREWGYIQSVHATPAYHFSVFNTGLSEYKCLYFNVDALSGEITTMAGL
jgi:hypothetical protein